MATTRHDRATDQLLEQHLQSLERTVAAMEIANDAVRSARTARDAAIREAVAAGLSLRQIGGALGLSAQGVNATLAGSSRAVYDAIGQTYSQTRRPDPRVRDAIWTALGDARSVVNVGAGTGSYEPPQTILAVEPSMVMIAQRAPELAPAAVTTAARIPLPDKSVDAALAVLTIHHWSDREACFAELMRVARRVVILTWDQELTDTFWLTDYVPAIIESDAKIAVPIDWICDQLGTSDVRPVPVPWDCTDGFLGAFWRRPEAYLDPVVRNGISTLTRIDQQVMNAGLELLLEDLQSGEWRRRHADLLDLQELDLGYRLIVAGVG
jgi:SAM-dependent methyltransferase